MSDTKQVLDFAAYSVGFVCASICTSLPIPEAAQRLNLEHPTGVGPWTKSDEPFRTGQSNPCPCNKNPETHKHYLFVC